MIHANLPAPFTLSNNTSGEDRAHAEILNTFVSDLPDPNGELYLEISRPLLSFQLFPKLPLEIRSNVWGHILHRKRKVEFLLESEGQGLWLIYLRHNILSPILLRINKESRSFGFKHYKPIGNIWGPDTFIIPSTETLQIRVIRNKSLIMALNDQYITTSFLETIGNIQSLKFTGVKWDEDDLEMIQYANKSKRIGGGLKHFWNLRNITLIGHKSEEELDTETKGDWKKALAKIFQHAKTVGKLEPKFGSLRDGKSQTLDSPSMKVVTRQDCLLIKLCETIADHIVT